MGRKEGTTPVYSATGFPGYLGHQDNLFHSQELLLLEGKYCVYDGILKIAGVPWRLSCCKDCGLLSRNSVYWELGVWGGIWTLNTEVPDARQSGKMASIWGRQSEAGC